MQRSFFESVVSRSVESLVQVLSVALTCLVVLGAVANSAHAQQQYIITDLGNLGYPGTAAYGLNDSGVVVGMSYLSQDGTRHSFKYENGTLTDLGTLGGSVSYAYAINASGQIVGVSAITGNTGNHAYLLSNGSYTDLGTLGGPDSTAYAINASGQIVGSSRVSGGSADRAFLYANNQLKDLGTLGGLYSFAYGINDSGLIVGDSTVQSGWNHAFSYANNQMTDLGTLGGSFSTAKAVNNNGQIVGWAATQVGSNATRAFLYSNGTMTPLGNPSDTKWSRALAINNQGQIVGSTSDNGDNPRAFLYSNGTMVDLNTLLPANSGWVLTEATGINNNGQIIGQGTFNGSDRAFLMSPFTPPNNWTFNWPAANSVWKREPNKFTQTESNTVWNYTSSPTFLRWSFISGGITAPDGRPRGAWAIVTDEQSLGGTMLQFKWPPVVPISATKNSARSAARR